MNKSRFPPTEFSFEKMLEELKSENKILGWFHAEENDSMDIKGIDFLVILVGYLSVTVQIKSSFDRVDEHLRKHPLIRLVMIVPRSRNNADKEKIKKDLKREFMEKVNDFIRQTRLV